MKKLSIKLVLLFILSTQMLSFVGCTLHKNGRYLKHSLTCPNGTKTDLVIDFSNDFRELKHPAP